jgi:hypothetical protein
MSNEKTVWNKELFSDTYETEKHNDDNFQTMNMIYKIEKINKAKKVNNQKNYQKNKNKLSKMENYKGIEPLVNIHDVNDDEPTPIIEGLKPRVTADDPNFLGLPDKDFDGIDTPSSRDNSKDPRYALINFIDNIFKKIDKFNYHKAYIFARAFSGGKPDRNDVNVLKKYIGWFETILISYFACYNWFFLMYYRYSHNDNVEPELLGQRYKTPILDTYDFQNQCFIRKDFSGMVYRFINYFFIYSLMFMEFLQNIMMEKIPKISAILFNLKGCFVVVFLLMLCFFQYYTRWLLNFLKDILTGNTKNLFVGLMFFLLLLGYFCGTYTYGYLEKTPGYTFHTFADFFMSFPFSLITAFLRFIVLMIVSVPIAGILCTFYIVYQSMFGILFNVGIFEFLGLSFASKTIFQKINEYIKDNNRSKKSPVKNFFNLAIDKFIYSNILNIAFFVMFIFAIIDYNTANHIKNSNLKINLNAITVTLIIIFFTVIAAQIYEEFKINVVEIPTLEKNVDEEDNGLIEELRNIITDVSKEMLEPILKEAGPLINETAQVVKNVNTIAENAENTLKETTSGISSATDTFNDAGKEYSNLIPTDTNVSNSTDIK